MIIATVLNRIQVPAAAIVLAWLLGVPDSAAGAQSIGTNTLLALPTSASWSSVVNFRPGDGEIVNVNPPRFSWSYTPNPMDSYGDSESKEFQFQVAYDEQFGNPVVNVRTRTSAYNFLAPFLAGRVVYWRVGYIHSGEVNPYAWSKVRSFSITNAVDWDRSMLASESYLASKSQHPHLLFNAANRGNLLAYLNSGGDRSWTLVIDGANSALTSPWWNLIGRWSFEDNQQWNSSISLNEYANSVVWDNADGNFLRVNGHAAVVAGKFGSGGRLGGSALNTSNYLVLSSNQPALANFSLTLWVNVSNSPDVTMPVWNNGSDEIMVRPSGGIAVQFNGVATNFATGNNANQWLMLAILKNNDTIYVFRNGTNIGSVVVGSAPVPFASSVMGKPTHAMDYLTGAFDEICLFDRALQPAEITSLLYSVVSIYDYQRSPQLGQLMFAWQMTRDSRYSSARPQNVLLRIARCYVAQNGPISDHIGKQVLMSMLSACAFGYDWLYELMTPEERQTVLNALALRCKYISHGAGWWFDPADSRYSYGKGDPTGTYPGTMLVRSFSCAKVGDSHSIDNFHDTVVAALAAYGDDPRCRDLLDLGLHYMIGITYPYGHEAAANQGLGYAEVHLLTGTGDALFQHILTSSVFPEAQLQRNPFWQGNAEWWSRMAPVGYRELSGPWGDACWEGTSSWNRRYMGRNLALFTGNRNAYEHHQQEVALKFDASYDWFGYLPIPYYFATPTGAVLSVPLARSFLTDGWVMANSLPTYSANAFGSGVGFIFHSRPRGSECGHSHFSDLSFQLWAYGSTLTDGGGGMNSYAKHPMSHYTLLANGIGTCQPQSSPLEAFYGRIIAFQEGSNWTYAAAEGAPAYPRKPFVPGGWLTPSGFGTYYATAPLKDLTRVQRHILMMRQKYFVVYDDLAATTNYTFSSLYHVRPNTLANMNGASFDYSVTNAYNGSNVLVYVRQIVQPSTLSVTNLTGTNVAANPITGENYWFQSYYTRPRANAVWTSSRSPMREFHFMTVIYPVKPGTSPPQITRLDDYTVDVTSGAEHDVISFDSQTQHPATLIVDVPAIAAGSSGAAIRPRTPSSLIRFFEDGDLTDPAGLAVKLNAHADAVSAFVWNQLSTQEQQILANSNTAIATVVATEKVALNRIVKGSSIYDAQRFAGVTLSIDTQNLMAQNPQGTKLWVLNRMLLADAYPSGITKSIGSRTILQGP